MGKKKSKSRTRNKAGQRQKGSGRRNKGKGESPDSIPDEVYDIMNEAFFGSERLMIGMSFFDVFGAPEDTKSTPWDGPDGIIKLIRQKARIDESFDIRGLLEEFISKYKRTGVDWATAELERHENELEEDMDGSSFFECPDFQVEMLYKPVYESSPGSERLLIAYIFLKELGAPEDTESTPWDGPGGIISFIREAFVDKGIDIKSLLEEFILKYKGTGVDWEAAEIARHKLENKMDRRGFREEPDFPLEKPVEHSEEEKGNKNSKKYLSQISLNQAQLKDDDQLEKNTPIHTSMNQIAELHDEFEKDMNRPSFREAPDYLLDVLYDTMYEASSDSERSRLCIAQVFFEDLGAPEDTKSTPWDGPDGVIRKIHQETFVDESIDIRSLLEEFILKYKGTGVHWAGAEANLLYERHFAPTPVEEGGLAKTPGYPDPQISMNQVAQLHDEISEKDMDRPHIREPSDFPFEEPTDHSKEKGGGKNGKKCLGEISMNEAQLNDDELEKNRGRPRPRFRKSPYFLFEEPTDHSEKKVWGKKKWKWCHKCGRWSTSHNTDGHNGGGGGKGNKYNRNQKKSNKRAYQPRNGKSIKTSD